MDIKAWWLTSFKNGLKYVLTSNENVLLTKY